MLVFDLDQDLTPVEILVFILETYTRKRDPRSLDLQTQASHVTISYIRRRDPQRFTGSKTKIQVQTFFII